MPIEQLPEEFIHCPKAVFDKLNEVIEAFNAPFPVISDEVAEKVIEIQAEEPVKYVGPSQIAMQIAEVEKNPAKPYS
jgi:hypothetical protein